MTIEVRRATDSDRRAIECFISENYGALAPFKGPERWNWQFQANPFLNSRQNMPPVWIALDGPTVVGQIAVQAARVKIDDVVHAGGWVVDVMVAPSHRGRGLGQRLHDAVASEVPVLLTLTMAPATRSMANRGGAVTLGPTLQFSRWRNVKSSDVRRYIIQRTAHRPKVSKLAKVGCDVFAIAHFTAALLNIFTAINRGPSASMLHPLTIVEVERFDEEVSDLWGRAGPAYPAICPRDSTFLNWRFVDCPQLIYRRFLVHRGAQVVGYSILRETRDEELRQGVIVDLFTDRADHEALDALVDHALGVFANRVASVECGTSVPEIAAALRQRKFLVTRRHSPTVVTANSRLRERIVELQNEWYLSKADHDWDQVHVVQ